MQCIVSAIIGPPERPLTCGEALMKLFLDNAENGRSAANDAAGRGAAATGREIQALAVPPPPRGAQRRDRVGSCR